MADASGLDSIVIRYEYDQSKNSRLRNSLKIYNKEDCINLKKLKDVIQDISHNSFRQYVRAADDHDQPLNSHCEKAFKDFRKILKSAHGKYEQSKISLKAAKNKSNVRVKNCRNHGYLMPKYKIDKMGRRKRKLTGNIFS